MIRYIILSEKVADSSAFSIYWKVVQDYTNLDNQVHRTFKDTFGLNRLFLIDKSYSEILIVVTQNDVQRLCMTSIQNKDFLKFRVKIRGNKGQFLRSTMNKT